MPDPERNGPPAVAAELPPVDPCPACGHASARPLWRRTVRGRIWRLARCAACGQHFTTPLPDDEDIRSFYAGPYHAVLRTDGGTEAAFAAKYRRYTDTLARYLTSGTVLDVGCSTGLLVKVLRDRGYDAQGTELNAESAAYGRTHYGVTIHNQPLSDCGFAPGTFDALLMTDVLEHTRHPGAFLRDAARWLAPGGIALITFPDISSLESRYEFMLARLLRRDWLWASCRAPLHVWEFTPATAAACFTGAGFRILELRRIQPPPDVLTTTAERLLLWPTRVLSMPTIARRFGTQMEFVIQKVASPGPDVR